MLSKNPDTKMWILCEILEQAKLIYSGRMQVSDCLGRAGREELTTKGREGTFFDNENVLYLD